MPKPTPLIYNCWHHLCNIPKCMELKDDVVTPGILDGKTILRFTHSKSEGAGIENHLNYLNRELLQRNSMTIIQLYTPGDQIQSTESISIGKGTLLKIPLPVNETDQLLLKQRPFRKFIDKISNELVYTSSKKVLDTIRFINYLLVVMILGEKNRKMYESRFLEAGHLDIVIRKLFKRKEVDLVINHFIGGKDSLLLMKEASSYKIPVLVLNHFSNLWFNMIPVREQLRFATLTAGVTCRDIPRYIRKQFVNLSNGIDTDFFNPSVIIPQTSNSGIYPLLLLPARIARVKGQIDLLKVAVLCHSKGCKVYIFLAGRIDSLNYLNELKTFIRKHNLDNFVTFKGTLGQKALRLLYSESTIVVLPTYHEGFPRVLLEAQAMKIPAVAYRVDGTPEAIVHKETGLLVDKGNIAELYKSIIFLLQNENIRLRMGVSGRDYVTKNFSLTALAQRHENAYSCLINKRSVI